MPTNALENTFYMSSLSLVDFYELECKYVLNTALYACTRATILVYCEYLLFNDATSLIYAEFFCSLTTGDAVLLYIFYCI